MLFSSLYSLLVSQPSGLGYESAWQKEADILTEVAIMEELHRRTGDASTER